MNREIAERGRLELFTTEAFATKDPFWVGAVVALAYEKYPEYISLSNSIAAYQEFYST